MNTVEKITRHNIRAIAKLEHAALARRTRGQRISDKFVHTLGSWNFLIMQSIMFAIWIGLNVTGWIQHWDPYPFILLNLVLSFQAAYATPIIMMSQNRQSQAHELRNQLDLQINLLAEQELTKILTLLTKLCEKSGIDLTQDQDLLAMETNTRPSKIIKQIETILSIKNETD